MVSAPPSDHQHHPSRSRTAAAAAATPSFAKTTRPVAQHNGKKDGGRIRVTNRALEAQRFSTVRLRSIKNASDNTASRRPLAPALRAGTAGRVAYHQQQRQQQAAAADAGEDRSEKKKTPTPRVPSYDFSSPSKDTTVHRGGFDPLPNDPTFVLVEPSLYWPPPPMDAAVRALSSGGMDPFDRRHDEAMAMATATTHQHRVISDLKAPRLGKALKEVLQRRVKVRFDESSSTSSRSSSTSTGEPARPPRRSTTT